MALSEFEERRPEKQRELPRDGDYDLLKDELYDPEETAKWYRIRIAQSWLPPYPDQPED